MGLGVVGACFWPKTLDQRPSSLIDLFAAITLLFGTQLFTICKIVN